MADYLPGHHAGKYRKQTKSLTSSDEKPSCDRNPLEGALGIWSLSPHLHLDPMGNSMKIRMRFIQNMQWRQQKGCDKNDALDDNDLFLVPVLVSPLVKKEKGQRLNTSDLCFRWWAIQDSNL